jgi:hypothetical protein
MTVDTPTFTTPTPAPSPTETPTATATLTPEFPPLPSELLVQYPDASIEKTESGWEARDSQGNTIGWYDSEANRWIMRYETLFEISEYPPTPNWLQLHSKWVEKEGGLVESQELGEFINRAVTFAGRVKRVFTEKVPINNGKITEIYWMTMTYGNGDKIVDVLLFTENNKTLLEDPEGVESGLLIVDKQMPDVSNPYSQEQVLTALRKSVFVEVEIDILGERYLPAVKESNNLVDDNGRYRAGYLQGKYLEEQLQFVEALLSGNFEGVKDGIPFGSIYTWIYTSH